MDETTATIQRGCRLARELEENLDNLANQPEILTRFCDEIISVFSHVKERISYSTMVHHGGGHDHQQPQQQLEMGSSGVVQEWLRSGSTTTTDFMLRAQGQVLGSRGAFGLHGGVIPEPGIEHETATGLVEMRGREAEVSMRSIGDDVQPMEVSNASRGSSSSQRPRRRRDEGKKWTETVPAPQMGNTEIPPDDGYTWRKYGQKDILNSNFPRSYFRCTHQKLYNCPAKKQVQRLDDDPDMFIVTYRDEHTCHLSSTAPSVPPPSLQLRQGIIPQPPAATFHHHPPGPSSSVPLSHWLSMDIIRPSTGEGTTSNITPSSSMHMFMDFSLATAGPSNSGAGAGAAGPSTAVPRFGEYQPVTDLADVMFNSGSSSNNSMDFIFPTMDDKWDSGEKKS